MLMKYPYTWQRDGRQIRVELLTTGDSTLDSNYLLSLHEPELKKFKEKIDATGTIWTPLAEISEVQSNQRVYLVCVIERDSQDWVQFSKVTDEVDEYYYEQLLPSNFSGHLGAFRLCFYAAVEEMGSFSIDEKIRVIHHCTLPNCQEKIDDLTIAGAGLLSIYRNPMADCLYDIEACVKFSELDILRSLIDVMIYAQENEGNYHGIELDIGELKKRSQA